MTNLKQEIKEELEVDEALPVVEQEWEVIQEIQEIREEEKKNWDIKANMKKLLKLYCKARGSTCAYLPSFTSKMG